MSRLVFNSLPKEKIEKISLDRSDLTFIQVYIRTVSKAFLVPINHILPSRYFQIARCYRDEATRPDRQPEFTQLDIELSFTDRDHVMSLIEGVLVHCWPESNGSLSTPFQRMTFDEAMEKYGSDKPDLRFDMQLQNVTTLVALNEDIAKSTPGFAAYALVLKHPQSNVKNQMKKQLKELEKDLKAHLVISKLSAGSVMEWVEGPLKNLFSSVVLKALAANLHLEKDDMLVLGYGKKLDCVSRNLSH